MELVQFENPRAREAHVGYVDGDVVRDVTADRADLAYVYDLFQAAFAARRPLVDFVRSLVPSNSTASFSMRALLSGTPGGSTPFVCPPLDHADPHRVLVTGTGLTHTGSMQSRDQMHAAQKEAPSGPSSPAKEVCDQTDDRLGPYV